MEEQGGLCFWCGKPLKFPTIDHLIAVSAGGTNKKDNCVVACPKCNGTKGSVAPEEFVRKKLLEVQAFLTSDGFKRFGKIAIKRP